MYLVVDTNIVFSALLSKAKTFDIFIANALLNKYKLIAPEFLFLEIGKHFDEILERSKLSSEDLSEVFKFIKTQIEFIPFNEFNKFLPEAETVSPHYKDVQYFALALSYHCTLWSNESAFKNQHKIKVYSTYDMLKELGLI